MFLRAFNIFSAHPVSPPRAHQLLYCQQYIARATEKSVPMNNRIYMTAFSSSGCVLNQLTSIHKFTAPSLLKTTRACINILNESYHMYLIGAWISIGDVDPQQLIGRCKLAGMGHFSRSPFSKFSCGIPLNNASKFSQRYC